MNKIKFFRFYNPDEDEVQNALDEFIEEKNPNIKSVSQTSVATDGGKYLYMTILYGEQHEGLKLL